MKFEFLSKYFPPPIFLKPPHFGLVFTDVAVKAVAFEGSPSEPKLRSAVVPIEKGAIAEGKIVNMDEVVSKLVSIKDFFAWPFVFFTMPDELAYIFQVSVPVSLGAGAAESIAFTIEENVPLPLTDTIFDFVPVQISKSESEYKAQAVVAACMKKETERFVEAVVKSGLQPVGCMHESQAIANAIIPRNMENASCIVHTRANRIGIYLVKGNMVQFSTIRSVAEGDYKRQLLDEYDKFLEYSLKYGANKEELLDSILVCGEFEYAQKAVEIIIGSKHANKNIKLSNVWSNVLKIEDKTPSVSFEDSLNLAGPIGAVLAGVL